MVSKKVSVSVSEKFGIEKSIGFGIEKFWYRKKVSVSVSFRFLVSSLTAYKWDGGMDGGLSLGGAIYRAPTVLIKKSNLCDRSGTMMNLIIDNESDNKIIKLIIKKTCAIVPEH